MEEQTTTEAPVETGGQEPLPEQTEQVAAATQANDQENNESQTGEPSSLPEVDDKLQKYAESHGLELDSPNAVKAAKMAMENQAEFHRTRQKASELEKSMLEQSDQASEYIAEQTGENPDLLKRLNRMEVRDQIRDFWDSRPDARQYEQAIKEKILESGITGEAGRVLEAAYAMVLADNQGSLKSEGARQALQTLASKQQASAPTGSAVNSAPVSKPAITRQLLQEKVAAGDVAWLDKNQATINALVAEGKLQ